jgi:phage tail sheath protein FI
MPEYLHPGVYVQEVPAAVRPIEGASTSTAGFVGVADKGPVPGFPMPIGALPVPPLLTSFAEYTRLFGGFRRDSFLTYAVQNFFDNGGKRAFIARVVTFGAPEPGSYGPGGAPSPNARLAAIGLADREGAPNPTLGIVARSPGAWGNSLGVEIVAATQDPAADFKLVVLEDGLPVESFDDLSMDANAENFVDTVVNSRSELIYVRASVPDGVSLADARPQLTEESQVVSFQDDGANDALTLAAPVSLGGAVKVTSTRDAGTTFKLVVSRGDEVLQTYAGLTMDPNAGNFVTRKVNAAPGPIRVENVADVDTSGDAQQVADRLAAARPVDGDQTSPVTPLPAVAEYDAGPGADGDTPPPGDQAYLGRSDLGTGLRAFDKINDVNILAIPGQGSDLVISGAMAYCKNRPLQDAFFVADLGILGPDLARTPGAIPSGNDKNEAREFVRSLSTPNDYGAIYYPWIRVADPIGRGRNPMIALPPSGFVAGLYARIDNSRGVFKAPAGTEAGLSGALGLTENIQDTDQDTLNPIGLNVIRRFPGYGIVTWGTRTLSTDAAWRYVPVRRTAIFLRVSIYRGIQWAVFEPNDAPLWAELRLNITAFMLTQFRAGAFQGSTPADAFFVKCDSSTTTQQDIDNGVVNILVGFAPLKPAEFVILKLSQKVNQPAA